ncbi:RidA family protein [Leeia sp. TBRC 13508]|uniref:RidA family protein n=1 Tax=Leeia speluncae TaxID=2884804 RepID=A0ABS8D323_9NEIS|nr:RidA family protein [Leeia speluncae]MCB6182398.1 RidA family protein [Leeia speluncae]
MSQIERIGVTKRWSDVVLHGQTAYFVEVPDSLHADIQTQTKEVLASVEQRLAGFGSDKTRLLQVVIYLTDMRYLAEFNELWDSWLPEGSAPSRACVKAELADPGYKVELVITAAR